LGKKIVLAAGCRHSIGMETFGTSAPLKEMQKKFGFTPENVIVVAKEQIAEAR
jgi:transketolase